MNWFKRKWWIGLLALSLLLGSISVAWAQGAGPAKRDINKKNKTALRKQIKKLRDAIQNKDKDAAQELLPPTFSLIDKSVKKGTIHENRGNRYKSRLSHQVGLITSPPSK